MKLNKYHLNALNFAKKYPDKYHGYLLDSFTIKHMNYLKRIKALDFNQFDSFKANDKTLQIMAEHPDHKTTMGTVGACMV